MRRFFSWRDPAPAWFLAFGAVLEMILGTVPAAILVAQGIAPYDPGIDAMGLPTPWVLTGQASAVAWGCVALAALVIPAGVGLAPRRRAWPSLCAAVAEALLISGVALGVWWGPSCYPAFFRAEGRAEVVIYSAAGGLLGLVFASTPALVAAVSGVKVGRRLRARTLGAASYRQGGLVPHPTICAVGGVVVGLILVAGMLAMCVLMAANF